jgi:hypothetical protein
LAVSPYYIFGAYAAGGDIYYLSIAEGSAGMYDCLLKYTGGEPERLKVLEHHDDEWAWFRYLRQWKNELLLPGILGRSFAYDMDTGETRDIRTADLDNSDFPLQSPGVVCGNYLYYNYTPYEEGYVTVSALVPVRYNLMTGEEEAFTP